MSGFTPSKSLVGAVPVDWYRRSDFQHLIVHSNSTSAIAGMCHSGAGPGQGPAANVHQMVGDTLFHERRSAELFWIKAHTSIPANERADRLAGAAAEKTKPPTARPPRILEASDLREVSKCERQMARRPQTPRRRGNPPTPRQRNRAWIARGMPLHRRLPKSGQATGAPRSTSSG